MKTVVHFIWTEFGSFVLIDLPSWTFAKRVENWLNWFTGALWLRRPVRLDREDGRLFICNRSSRDFLTYLSYMRSCNNESTIIKDSKWGLQSTKRSLYVNRGLKIYLFFCWLQLLFSSWHFYFLCTFIATSPMNKRYASISEIRILKCEDFVAWFTNMPHIRTVAT